MRSGAKMKHLSTLKIRIFLNFFFAALTTAVKTQDLSQLPLMLSGLGTPPPLPFGVETGWQTVSRRLPRCYLSSPGKTHWGILILSPFTPLKFVAEPWEEPKRALTSTMVPLIVTYFPPAGRTRCCKRRHSKVIVSCTEGPSLHGHLPKHTQHQLREHTQ